MSRSRNGWVWAWGTCVKVTMMTSFSRSSCRQGARGAGVADADPDTVLGGFQHVEAQPVAALAVLGCRRLRPVQLAQRARGDQTFAGDVAPVAVQQEEAADVVERGDERAPGVGEPVPRLPGRLERSSLANPLLALIARGYPRREFRGGARTWRSWPDRVEQPLLHQVGETLAGHDLGDPARHHVAHAPCRLKPRCPARRPVPGGAGPPRRPRVFHRA